MNYQTAFEKLHAVNESQVFQFWSSLNSEERERLINEVEALNLKTLQLQQEVLNQKTHQETTYDPFLDFAHSNDIQNRELGLQLLQQGLVGCLLIAGGQGTRLRINGPKGTFGITPIKKKSLFQLISEKVVAARKQSGCHLPFAVMTSPLNHVETMEFFERHNHFGLTDPEFFSQTMLSLLNEEGHLFLETPSHIANGPAGNGNALHHFVKAGLWEKWHRKGIRYLTFVLVDNALSDPFDAELIGFNHRTNAEITVKCVQRQSENEKVGLLVKKNDSIEVIEYSEMSEEERQARLPNGDLKHQCANISTFCFRMDFIKKLVDEAFIMPLHKAFKAATFVTPAGKSIQSHHPIAWKFETFIFDVLKHAQNVNALLYPRNIAFAPLKNAEGNDSPLSVQQLLLERDRQIFQDITGLVPPNRPFELSMDFYYPTPQQAHFWRGKPLPNDSYIEI